jgi:integrase
MTPQVTPACRGMERPAHTRALKASKVKAFRIYDLRHTWATRAAEAGIDVGTLASLLGHSKLVMVMRYVHPGEAHRTEAVKKLELANAAKEIAEAEKKVGTVLGTAGENPGNFSESKNGG